MVFRMVLYVWEFLMDVLASGRYALADQVEVVRSDSFYLKVDKDKTLKF
jgi:hypothetical protein